MVYLHKSVFQSHGYLSSANCHVDSRWVLKISGFALHAFRKENYKEQVNVRILHYFCCWYVDEILFYIYFIITFLNSVSVEIVFHLKQFPTYYCLIQQKNSLDASADTCRFSVKFIAIVLV